MTSMDALGVVMLDVAGLQLTPGDREVLANPQVGGVILGLFKRNFASVAQLQDLVAEIRDCNESLLIAVDQEGGRVQRFQKEFTRLPPMYTFGKLYQEHPGNALSLASTCGWLMAAEVLSCGLDLSFAPVLDLYNQSSRIIADRAFSADPAEVGRLATAFISGMHKAGMKATGKHFPGHGTVEADSHVELPVDPRDLDELMRTDLLPFVHCASVMDAVMPAHVLYPKVDDNCAALSQVWLQQLLRLKLGFEGLIFSDDLTMAAAGSAGNIVNRAEAALGAGCDMILICNDREGAMDTLDWLHNVDYPLNEKLPAMKGEHVFSRSELLSSDSWQQASEAIRELAG